MINENLGNLVDVAEVPEDVAFQRVKEKFDSSGHDFSKSVRAGIQEEMFAKMYETHQLACMSPATLNAWHDYCKMRAQESDDKSPVHPVYSLSSFLGGKS